MTERTWSTFTGAMERIKELEAAVREIEALCHSETRQKLLAICQKALASIGETHNEA